MKKTYVFKRERATRYEKKCSTSEKLPGELSCNKDRPKMIVAKYICQNQLCC